MQKDSGCMEVIDMTNAGDAEIANKNPGLVFRVGEKLKLKDGDFKVKSFGKKIIVLEGLPGTRIIK